jgi:ubiquinone/menaquinone biosynthesis C-methylase UbiE
LASAVEIFDERAASHYESWYETLEGRRADAEEKDALASLLDCFPRAGSVLEVGCGTGHFTRWLSAQGLAAVGLDLSAAMLAQAQALDGVTLVHGDSLGLPFADGAFDLVAFITTLEFLERPRVALTEALRVTHHGLLLGVLNRWSPLGLWRRLVGLIRPTVYEAARFFGLAELKRLLWSVAGEEAGIAWRIGLFPRGWPGGLAQMPWGGFIGMALVVDRGLQGGE